MQKTKMRINRLIMIGLVATSLLASCKKENTSGNNASKDNFVAIIEQTDEANNGGRLFKNAVEKECRIIGNNKTKFTAFHQKDNKQQRIFQNSADVQNICFMPQGWNLLFPEFYQAITSYMKVGNNDHDDAPDALTGTVEKRKNAGTTDVAGLFGR